MSKKVIMGMALAVALASCNSDELADWANESVELKATVETPAISRVGFDNEAGWSFFWHNGDRINVNSGIMSTTATTGATMATFNGYGIDTSTGYAAYPCNYSTISDNTVTINFPAEYDLTTQGVDEDYFAAAQNVAMYAKVEDGTASFKHLGGVIVFKFNEWKFTGDQVFTFTASKRVTGDFTANLQDETPVIKADEGEATTGNVVTIKFSTTETQDLVFYVPVPVGAYDFDLDLKVEGVSQFTKSYKLLTVNRADICYTSYGESSLDAGASTAVDTKEELSAALTEGGNVVLAGGISDVNSLAISENTVIDLNGNNLSLADKTSITVAEGKTLTIKDSQTPSTYARSTAASASITGSGDIIKAGKNSTIIIGEGVNLTTTGASSCCVFVPDRAENVTVNTAGNLLATTAGAGVIYVNGNVTSGTINITGGSVKHSADVAVYIAGKANLNISGDAVIEGTTAVEVRAGEVTVTGGTLKATSETFSATANGNGSTSVGAALAVTQHNTNYDLKATISGGTFTGVKALYEEDTCDDNVSGISMSVTGGTFNGVVSSENCAAFITGGTFSDASAFDYLGEDANVTVGADMELAKAITITKTATINLNGKTIENKTAGHPSMITPNVDDECVVFMVNGNLTINGEGNVKATGDGTKTDYNTAVWAMGTNAKVIINGGNYTNSVDTDNDGCDLIYARDGAKIKINGGSFQSYIRSTLGGGIYDVLDCKDNSGSTITVNGGTFQNYAPSYENVGTNEVILGTDKKVYNGENEVTTAHNTEDSNIWYTVK